MGQENALPRPTPTLSPFDEFLIRQFRYPAADGIAGNHHFTRERIQVRIAVGTIPRLPQVQGESGMKTLCAPIQTWIVHHPERNVDRVQAVRVELFRRAHRGRSRPSSKPLPTSFAILRFTRLLVMCRESEQSVTDADVKVVKNPWQILSNARRCRRRQISSSMKLSFSEERSLGLNGCPTVKPGATLPPLPAALIWSPLRATRAAASGRNRRRPQAHGHTAPARPAQALLARAMYCW